MARNANKPIIVGTLGRDPEVRYTAGGSAVANVSVATNDTWNDRNTGENIEKRNGVVLSYSENWTKSSSNT